jgi:hypothetical protein
VKAFVPGEQTVQAGENAWLRQLTGVVRISSEHRMAVMDDATRNEIAECLERLAAQPAYLPRLGT